MSSDINLLCVCVSYGIALCLLHNLTQKRRSKMLASSNEKMVTYYVDGTAVYVLFTTKQLQDSMLEVSKLDGQFLASPVNADTAVAALKNIVDFGPWARLCAPGCIISATKGEADDFAKSFQQSSLVRKITGIYLGPTSNRCLMFYVMNYTLPNSED